MAQNRFLMLLALMGYLAATASSAQTEIDKIVVTAPGRVASGESMPIGVAVSGVIAEVLVNEGDHVEAGQLLVRLACAHLEKELDGRRAALESAEAALERAINGARPEEIGIGVANVGLAEARAEEAGIVLNRATALVAGVTISKAQLDQAKRDARVTAAMLEEARAKLALLRAGSRPEDVAEARARRDLARAQVAQAAVSLDYCSVRAPVAGVVLSRNVSSGQFVSTAVPVALLTLIDDRRRHVRAEVDERDLAKICVSQRAVVSSDSFPGIQAAAISEQVGVEMKRRTLPAPDGSDRDVRELTLTLADNAPAWPVGMRVLVKLAACPKV